MSCRRRVDEGSNGRVSLRLRQELLEDTEGSATEVSAPHVGATWQEIGVRA